MRNTSLRGQLIRAAVLTTFVAVFLNAIALLINEAYAYRKSWVINIQTTANVLADASAAALEFDDPKAAEKTLGTLQSTPQVQWAVLYKRDGTPFARYIRKGEAAELPPRDGSIQEARFNANSLEIAYPVQGGDELLGQIYISAQHDLVTRLLQFAMILLLSSACSALGAYLLFGRLQSRITAPLETMTEVAQQVIASHDWTLRAPSTHYRDIGQLVDAFNSLLSECETRTYKLELEASSRRGVEHQLRRADKQKNVFLATLAHELRNPLAPMTSAVGLLRLAKLSPETHERALQMLERQLKHMVRLISDLLDASRISNGQLSLMLEPVDLATLVATAVEEAEGLAQQQGIALRLYPSLHELCVLGDAVRLAQVFSNLLNNACRYTPRGGRVNVSMVSDSGSVFVFVQDTGIGVEPAMQKRIFDMFEQGERPLDSTNGGLGVGLSLSKQIVELHQGQISIRSEGRGKGSCFLVQLPLLQGADKSHPESQHSRMVQLRHLRILIADDNRDLAESFAELLRSSGHEVLVVHDGEAALHEARTRIPDIAMLDIGMPKLDGFRVARELRGASPTQDILLVAISGWGRQADKLTAEEAGFDHYLIKPVEPSALVRILVDAFEEFASSRPGELL